MSVIIATKTPTITCTDCVTQTFFGKGHHFLSHTDKQTQTITQPQQIYKHARTIADTITHANTQSLLLQVPLGLQ